jgi:hypothetical protein
MTKPTVRRPHIVREWVLRLLLTVISLTVAVGLAEVLVRIFFPISDGRENVTLDGKPVQGWFEPGVYIVRFPMSMML